MSIGLLAGLAGLALVDSTSIGTLIIPIFLMLSNRPALGRRALVYLATVACFYFVVGVALMLGLLPAVKAVGDLADPRILRWLELAAGAVLLVLSFRLDPRRKREPGDRSSRWRERITRVGDSSAGMAVLGVTAAGLEVATMFPYLAAIGLLVSADLSPAVWLPVLGGYNLVMVLPALVLLALRLAAADRVRGPLNRLSEWLSRHSGDAVSWAVGIAGFLLARDAALHLGLFQFAVEIDR